MKAVSDEMFCVVDFCQYNLSFYLRYLSKWPDYFLVQEDPNDTIMGYSKYHCVLFSIRSARKLTALGRRVALTPALLFGASASQSWAKLKDKIPIGTDM